MASTPQQLIRKLERLESDLLGQGLQRALRQVGDKGKEVTTAAVRADIGDLSMSNWRRKRPIQIRTRYDLVSPRAVEILPTRAAGGPMVVLTRGRQPGVSRKGRPYPGSRGKGTWDDATTKMAVELPRVMHRHTTTVLRRTFGG